MSSEDQMIPMAQQQQQQQPPPTQQNTNYNDNEDPNEGIDSSPSPQQKRQLTLCQSSCGSSHEVLTEEKVVYRENRYGKIKYVVYEVLKIFQICVCLYFIIIGIILSFVYLVTNRGRWYYYPLSTQWHSHFWTSPFDVYLWYSIFISIFGLLGAVGDDVCPQILYTILNIPFIPYCFIPWLLLHAMFQGWHIPPQPLVAIRRISRHQISYI